MASVLSSRTHLVANKITSYLLQHRRDFKSALKIKWVRPEKIPFDNPKMSGDLATLGTVDVTQFPTPWKASQELQSADEIVKKIHTLEFFNRKVLKEEFVQIYSNRVKSHEFDDNSPEVKIAKITVKIRNLQIHMEQFRKDQDNKVRLKEAIDKRSQMLTRLKHNDYKKYEWLLEKLDLEHKAYKVGTHERVERKKSLRRLTMLYIEKLKAERLQDYRNLLESQQEDFFNEKLEKLIWIKRTEEECGVPVSVTEADIEAVREQLQQFIAVKPKEIAE